MKKQIMIQTRSGQLDPRIPIIYFSDSGSGKGMGQTFYQAIFKPAGLVVSSLAKPTPEKIIGSFDEQIDKENKKKGYTYRDEEYRDPVLHGFFETEEDVIFDEAECFFDGKDYGNDILRKSRMALDKYGSPNNAMKSETLKNRGGYSYHSKCNVMFLSYHIEKVSKQILANGIFQRSLCFFYRLGQDQMEDILLNPTQDLSEVIKVNKEGLISEIKKINNYIMNLNTNIKLTDGAFTLLEKTMKQQLKKIYTDDNELGKMLQSFLPRLRETMLKVAGALAVIKQRKVIDEIEIKEAEALVLSVSFPSLTRELVVFGVLAEEQRKWYELMRRNLGNRWRKKEEINSIMGQVWSVSRPTVISRLKKLAPMFIMKQGKKNTQYFKLK